MLNILPKYKEIKTTSYKLTIYCSTCIASVEVIRVKLPLDSIQHLASKGPSYTFFILKHILVDDFTPKLFCAVTGKNSEDTFYFLRIMYKVIASGGINMQRIMSALEDRSTCI